MSKCLFCYRELEEGQVDFHPSCARKFFGSQTAPILPYTRDNMSELARQVIRTSASVTGVQAKMSLDVDRGGKNEPSKFTIVGLWGKYIFKPQSAKYPCLPEKWPISAQHAIRSSDLLMVNWAILPSEWIEDNMEKRYPCLTCANLPIALQNISTMALICSWLKLSRSTLRRPCLTFNDFGRWFCFHGLQETPICTARIFHY